MPFESGETGLPRKIAVIGGGISGLGAAHLLSSDTRANHRVVLFEAAPELGGHARTVLAGRRGDQPVDTGFIVFNRANYPHLTALFEALDVPVAESNMSFAASIDGGRVEYGLASLDVLFAQRRNAMRPSFLRMCRDILHFNRNGARVAAEEPQQSVGDFLDRLGTGAAFREHYLSPFSGAIWSTPLERILDFPAHAMMEFFRNHALLDYDGQHQWYTVRGGSREYVGRLEAALRRSGVELRTGTPVEAVQRGRDGAAVRMPGGEWELFDEVILATHSDIALRLLVDASPEEAADLGAIRYQRNDAILHADAALMPKSRKVWSSWNYTEPKGARRERIDLTYWMNSLQPIPADDPMFLTLNTAQPIREELIYDQVRFDHPVFDLGAMGAQERIRQRNGQNQTWFCGAWLGNGFHEDGLASAHRMAEALHAKLRPTLRMPVAAE
ncbi:NAD(P)/FAD-dependent oxidoreductase [Poseidonocella sedimentorum]|uniref:Amine oxidase domain-containing protein n=1 Tax=Poseidonocella sedimentorum TaxID=871652 RepID=A0A1I6E8N3_9RHOB|nr:FAD-dependent oxidoreductase [Poseidonocella sedimentorum]SFR14079.1 hypothetical protein SAMN04515673_10878 [Poseidonocella sedimentorum]